MQQRSYIAIDLKSFYASVECRERGLDPLDTLLVVADAGRTDKTICLAASPALKRYGIPGRSRLFEVKQRIGTANALRQSRAPGKILHGSAASAALLSADPTLAIDFVIAPPRMSLYIDYSTRIYQIYTQYIAPEDIIVYSIDEVFLDVTHYLKTYACSAEALARTIIRAVFEKTGITATAGIGTNLFLSKVAMDLLAKHKPADPYGTRVAELDEARFRQTLWTHRPLTDFWRVGSGSAKRLAAHGIYTMGDIARCSVHNQALLYRLFGKNAELLIDHAWGWEPCSIADVKAYRPSNHSLGMGQVLSCPYDAKTARLVLREMAELLSLDLLEKQLVSDQIVIHVTYDIENLSDPDRRRAYHGPTVTDRYGRRLPKPASGSISLQGYSCSSKQFQRAAAALYDKLVDPALLVRKLSIAANHVRSEASAADLAAAPEQLDFLEATAETSAARAEKLAAQRRERTLQETTLAIKKKFGKCAIFKGMNLEKGATANARSQQIGGHKA